MVEETTGMDDNDSILRSAILEGRSGDSSRKLMRVMNNFDKIIKAT
jgi:hypothetical protein